MFLPQAPPYCVPGQYEMTNYDYETSDAGAVPVDLTHPAENAGDFYTFDGRQFIISFRNLILFKYGFHTQAVLRQ